MLPDYRRALAWVGEEIAMTLDRERKTVVRGILIGIDETGCLVLRSAEGERRFANGDIKPTTECP